MRFFQIAVTNAVLGIVLLAAAFPACASEPDAKAWKGDLPIRAAYLNKHMPPGAAAYVRIPDLMGFLTMPKGNSFDKALRSEANVENALRVRQGLIDNVLGAIPPLADPRLLQVIENLRSPVEMAVMVADDAPSATIAVNLGFGSLDAFADAMNALGDVVPVFKLSQPLDDQGFGLMAGPGMPIFLKFDPRSGQLLLTAGPAVTFESFRQMLDGIERETAHPMLAMEQRIDESGRGLFLWLDTRRIMPVMQAFLPPEQLASFNELGLDKVDNVALGWGVAGGKGRLALRADLASGSDRGFLPVIANDLGARSAGKLDGLFLLSIPDPEEFRRMESTALAKASAETAANWLKFKDIVQANTGIRIEEIFQAVGPDFAGIFDEAGDYGALKLRNAKLFDSIVERLAAKDGVSLEQRTIRRKTYTHLIIATGAMKLAHDDTDVEEAGAADWAQRFVGRERQHFYWTRDGDYLYLASTPQVLIDRHSLGGGEELGEWLTKNQKMDARNALLTISGSSEKLPRRIYGLYLEVLQYLADLGDAEMDMWAMPTPAQLGLSRPGTLGFSLSLGDPTIAAELTFENNPAEMLGGAGGVAVAGILAAIAIPAYQDYTHRAQVGEGLALAGDIRAAVEAYHMREGKFPDAQAAAQLSLGDNAGQFTRSITVEPFSGLITIGYFDEALPAGGRVFLRPVVEADGSLFWECSASIEDKYLPAFCRAD